jgi:hypothetical protein
MTPPPPAASTSEPARVVWLAPSDARPDARKALDEWAHARGVRLVAPAIGHGAAIPIDMTIADDVEDALAHAKDAIASLETDNAERALVHAESLLRAHPELPNAAWLMAEVFRGWAARFQRLDPIDVERAQEMRARASSFDGGRAAGVGEIATAAPKRVHGHLMIDDASAVIWIDGVEAKPGDLELAAGEHAIAITRDGIVVWADWISFHDGTDLRLFAPSAPACSNDDFARIDRDANSVTPQGVRCARWVAVFPEEQTSTIRVATCERNACGPLVEWRVLSYAQESHDTNAADSNSAWPAWVKWSIAGVCVVAAGTTALIASGAFKTRPTETHFVNGGLKVDTAGIRF